MARKKAIENKEVESAELTTQEVIEPSEPKKSVLNAKWYIISSSSNKENKTAQMIKQRIKANNLDEFVEDVVVPTQEKIVIKKGKKHTIEERYLPGYILIKMLPTDEVLHIIRNTEGVLGFLGATMGSKMLAPLSDKEAESIVAFNKVQQTPVYQTRLSINDAVKVVDGPFKDFVGAVQEVNESKGQVTVLLSIFGRETPVQLDFLQVNKI